MGESVVPVFWVSLAGGADVTGQYVLHADHNITWTAPIVVARDLAKASAKHAIYLIGYLRATPPAAGPHGGNRDSHQGE